MNPWTCLRCKRTWPQRGFRNAPCPYCGSPDIRPITPTA